MRRVLLFALALGFVAAPAVLAKKPPSFALWSARWQAQHDSGLDRLVSACAALYGETADRKVGECVVHGMREILRRESPKWEKAVALISRGQSVPCKEAIHVYWLASRKNQRAAVTYLDAHRHRNFTAVASDLKADPYATLSSLTRSTKAHANRVCG
jgi:hypothetical protein